MSWLLALRIASIFGIENSMVELDTSVSICNSDTITLESQIPHISCLDPFDIPLSILSRNIVVFKRFSLFNICLKWLIAHNPLDHWVLVQNVNQLTRYTM